MNDDDHDDHHMDTTGDDAGSPSTSVRCSVELETAVERFMLRMYEADDHKTDTNLGNEDGKGEEDDKEQETKGGEVARTQVQSDDRRRWEVWLLGTLDATTKGVMDGAVLLQRGLRASNLEFVEGEMRVLQDPADGNSSTREGWAIEVRRWRWARDKVD
jgi:hypothetical protein